MPAVSIEGVMDSDARAMLQTDGQALLDVRVALPSTSRGTQVLCRARKAYGTGHAAMFACQSEARRLRRGVRVHIRALTCRIQRGVLHIEGLESLHAPDFKHSTPYLDKDD